MAYYNVCPDCGCNLDPGEKCDCAREKKNKKREMENRIRLEEKSSQYQFNFDEWEKKLYESGGD